MSVSPSADTESGAEARKRRRMARTRVATTRAGAAETDMDDLFAAAGGAAVRKGVAAKRPEVAPYWKIPRGVSPGSTAETPIETGACATRVHGSGARFPAALIRWYRSAQLGSAPRSC